MNASAWVTRTRLPKRIRFDMDSFTVTKQRSLRRSRFEFSRLCPLCVQVRWNDSAAHYGREIACRRPKAMRKTPQVRSIVGLALR